MSVGTETNVQLALFYIMTWTATLIHSTMLTSILSLALCLPLVLGAPGWRVINGTEATKFEFKSMVSLWIQGYGQSICGGTLISANTVLTAAHCVTRNVNRPTLYSVHISGHNHDAPPKERQIVGVSKILLHPNWNGRALQYDYALLKLAKTVPAVSPVEYAPLPPSTKPITRTGDKCLVVGWGTTNRWGRPGSKKLMKGEMKVMDQSACKRVFRNVGYSHICAESAYISTSACKGDSGGPLYCTSGIDGETYQVGVVSFGRVPCGQRGVPTVFARVTSALDWIKKNM